MREMEKASSGIDEPETEGHQRINAARDQPVDKKLGEHFVVDYVVLADELSQWRLLCVFDFAVVSKFP